ncbi:MULTISPECIES: hypothetical protein [unclassified Synechococcus]|uniref:hypothetical protein n=1 Tax=unclassified Synechococcus TaxID=2626047 RepID=UPI0021A29EB9|nr:MULTISPECIES: hypothetical protein [unclassified Synechococcus]MCT0212428.1 hypothetical protein [Synechococcus sp. CS-1326]MCT0234611.1 hypothetical protein [Synechococcus sp. CS-1327]
MPPINPPRQGSWEHFHQHIHWRVVPPGPARAVAIPVAVRRPAIAAGAPNGASGADVVPGLLQRALRRLHRWFR